MSRERSIAGRPDKPLGGKTIDYYYRGERFANVAGCSKKLSIINVRNDGREQFG